jgi:hypothetical protein
MLSSRWVAIALFVGIALTVGSARFLPQTPAQPHQTGRFPASAEAEPANRLPAIPRIRLEIAGRADDRGTAPQGPGGDAVRNETAAPGIVNQDPLSAPPPAQSTDPARAREDISRIPSRPDPTVPQLMVCHLDTRGASGAADALQECVRRAPAYSSVEIPPGVYVLSHQVVVTTPLTIRTAGTRGSSVPCTTAPDQCASLVAAADFTDPWGVLLVMSTNTVTVEHLVIDGNRAARGASRAVRLCRDGNNIFGFNASVLDCAGCGVADVLSRNALCGTGLVWVGANASIRWSTFQSNGDAATGMWSDGLTVLHAPRSEISDNRLVDNSDVALIFGYAVSSRIERNVVQQRAQSAFAGLMLHNFNSTDLRRGGDYRGAVIANNTIDCGAQLCVFGMQIGPGPWSTKLIVVGGDVHDNVIRGAKVGINVDGAGMFGAPVVVHDNIVSDVPSGAYFSDCARPIAAEAMNVSPTSVVDRGDDTSPTGAYLSDPCQLSSDVTSGDE